jgi:uncharacterized membrane protein
MNMAHAHLLINHFPVVGSVLGLGALAVGTLLRRESWRSAALVLFAVVALTAVPSFLTGEPAEEVLLHRGGLLEESVERHEEAAEAGLAAAVALGILSVGALAWWNRKKTFPVGLAAAVWAAALTAAVLLGRAANYGGHIQHPELDDTAGPAAAAAPVPTD